VVRISSSSKGKSNRKERKREEKRREEKGKMADFHPDSIRNDTDSKTLSRLLMTRTHDPDFVILLNAISTACKLISRSVRKAGIAGLCKF
jgi:hypothetical protein